MRRALNFILIVAAVVLAAVAQAGDAPLGPAFGRNRVKSRIERGPHGIDSDDYVAQLARGETLSIRVISPFQSPLIPSLEILDPDGVDRYPEVATGRPDSKRLRVKRLAIDKTGPWGVRLSGRHDTEGAYTVAFSVRPARRVRRADVQIPEDGMHEVQVHAVDGSRLEVAVNWKKGRPGARIVEVVGPRGAPVSNPSARDVVRSGRRSNRLRRYPLESGTGTYVVRLETEGAAASVDIRTRVRPPPRPRGTQRISATEPHIIAPASLPIEGVEGMDVRLDCWNLSVGSPPRVLFGDVRAPEVIVDESGGFLHCQIPEGERGTTVGITIINPDGQASVADGLFHYVREPAITGITDLAGAPFIGGSSAGGYRVLVQGDHLRPDQLFHFGDAPGVLPLIRDGQAELLVPASTGGVIRLRLSDRFGHDVESPFEFELKDPPALAASPFRPAVVDGAGLTFVAILGDHFEATDTLLVDGVPHARTYGGAGLLGFVPAARPDGVIEVQVVDRMGLATRVALLPVETPEAD